MKLEESQVMYETLSDRIITTLKKRIDLRRKLQEANLKYQQTKEITFQSWEHSHIKDEISILGEELDALKEQRDKLLKHGKRSK